jgi:hypothetical protein
MKQITEGSWRAGVYAGMLQLAANSDGAGHTTQVLPKVSLRVLNCGDRVEPWIRALLLLFHFETLAKRRPGEGQSTPAWGFVLSLDQR